MAKRNGNGGSGKRARFVADPSRPVWVANVGLGLYVAECDVESLADNGEAHHAGAHNVYQRALTALTDAGIDVSQRIFYGQALVNSADPVSEPMTPDRARKMLAPKPTVAPKPAPIPVTAAPAPTGPAKRGKPMPAPTVAPAPAKRGKSAPTAPAPTVAPQPTRVATPVKRSAKR